MFCLTYKYNIARSSHKHRGENNQGKLSDVEVLVRSILCRDTSNDIAYSFHCKEGRYQSMA